MSTGNSWRIYSDTCPEALKEGEARVSLGDGTHVIVDAGIAPLVEALRAEGIDTLWSCQGGPGHMCQRPMVLAWASDVGRERYLIHLAMDMLGIENFWISLVFAYGDLPTLGCQQAHGGKYTWLIELPGPHDFLAVPVALNSTYLEK